jgi:hypothetical protein
MSCYLDNRAGDTNKIDSCFLVPIILRSLGHVSLTFLNKLEVKAAKTGQIDDQISGSKFEVSTAHDLVAQLDVFSRGYIFMHEIQRQAPRKRNRERISYSLCGRTDGN